MENLLAEYPVIVESPVIWGDMDAYEHVNNTVYFRYFESARIAFFDQLKFKEVKDETGIGPILASTQCRFRIPLTYPDTVSIGARVSDVQGDRFTMHYRVVSHQHKKVAAEGEGLLIAYDYKALTKAALPEIIYQRIQKLGRDQ
ncbi:thioesterase [Gammaproteobacteria bacterium 42_54_T18]|nr:thioesterase [Gammaproteobacteria bacterium 42_54_T18]